MMGYEQVIWEAFRNGKPDVSELMNLVAQKRLKVAPRSIRYHDGLLTMVGTDRYEHKKFIAAGKNVNSTLLTGVPAVIGTHEYMICPMNEHNYKIMSGIYDWMKPVCPSKQGVSLGLGDRLGTATVSHAKFCLGQEIFPVFAQQSMRELAFTGRTYPKVLADAGWAVYETGYENGFGADGDHLKNEEQIRAALDAGYTMITLDCSEQLDQDAFDASDEKILEKYDMIDSEHRKTYERRYGSSQNPAGIRIPLERLRRIVLAYGDMIDFAKKMYRIIKAGPRIFYEISVDETQADTSVEAHGFIASELAIQDVEIDSLAPKFCGSFEKGIDYIGRADLFAEQIKAHAEMADRFGHKLSIHSGSDKFSIFSMIGKATEFRFHLKTAGTHWLEAVRTIAQKEPVLYRKMHAYAIEQIDKARAVYHVSSDFSKCASVDSIKDEDLPALMDKDDTRQLLHISYGLLLMAKDEENQYIFSHDIYRALNTHEITYEQNLKIVLYRHMKLLGLINSQ